MKAIKILLIIPFWFLVSCSNTGSDTTTGAPTSAPTSVVVRMTATPRPATSTPTATAPATLTPSPTPIALDRIELESLLVQAGDLPAGVSAAQVRSTLPEMFDGISEPDAAIFQQFEKDNDVAGGVSVLLYSKPAALQDGYNYLIDGMDSDAAVEGLSSTIRSADVGDGQIEAIVTEMRLSAAGVTFELNEIVFSRCSALVHIRMTGGVGIAGITAYAERLDRRLESAVC